MRICLATDSPEPSGVGEHMLALAAGLDADVTVLARAHSPLLARAAAAGHAVRAYADDMSGWFARTRFDLVHVHAGIGWEGHELARAAKAGGAAVLRTEHLPWLLTEPAQIDAYRVGVAHVDRIIAVSHAVRDSHVVGGAADEERIVTVHNGVARPPATRGREAMRRTLHVGEAAVLLHVGRFTPQKNHRLLLAAMAALDRPAHLLLVGDGPDRAGIAREIYALGLADRVRLLGHRTDIGDLMAAADLLLMTSRFEGLPLSLLEAMATGLPAVAVIAPGIDETVDGDAGWLVPPDDPIAFAAAIATAIDQPEERASRGAAAQQRHAAQFTRERMQADTAAAYAIAQEREPMPRTRIAFIGAGGIAHRHIGVLEQMDDVEIVAFADLDADRARDAAARVGARSFADAAEMITTCGPDALYICVPPFAHGEPERLAIDHDLPFFVEKPVAIDLAQAEEIARDAAALVTAVGYHWRYLDSLPEVDRVLAGRPARLMSGYWLDATPPPRWWWRQEMSGGQMVEQTTHLVDLARRFGGRAVRVFGLAERTERPDHPGLNVATASTASILFENGAIANFASTCLLRWNHRVGLHLFGDGAAIELTDRDVMIDVGAGRPITPNHSDPVWHEDRDFIDAVQGKENRVRCSYADAVETLRIVLAIGESAETGRAIELEPSA